MSGAAAITVVETPEFLSATRKLLTEEERTVLVDYLAHNPGLAACASCDGNWKGAVSAAVHA
jgi:hypothetical protein